MRQIPIEESTKASVINRLGRTSLCWAGIMGLSATCLAAALISQHIYGMLPCPWCIVQRMIWVVVMAVALVGWGGSSFTRAPTVAGIGICISGVLGIAAALWQYFVAAPAGSCAFTWADRFISQTQLDAWLPAIFQPLASCAEAKVKLLGIPYALVSAAMFGVLTLWGLRIVWLELQRSRKTL